ncbi:MAG: hypothetical protein AB1330_01660 [Bacillota bacterium]
MNFMDSGGEAQALLFERMDALKDGTPEADRLVETLKEMALRYIFISAYVSVNRDAPDFPELAVEMLSGEDVWPDSTDPDVMGLFRALQETERACRALRMGEGAV